MPFCAPRDNAEFSESMHRWSLANASLVAFFLPLTLHGAPLQLLTLRPAVGPVRVGPFCVQGDRVYATASAPGPPLLVFDLKK